jgi:hypothetical protein
MLALIAVILFVLSPFIPTAGPWPLVTLGLAFLALHCVWPLPLLPRR